MSTLSKINIHRYATKHLRAAYASLNVISQPMSRCYSSNTAPPLPFEEVKTQQTNGVLAGYRKEDFLLDLDRWTFLDHAAFGAALNVGYNRAAAWRNYLERQPRSYLERELLPHMAYSTRLIADFLKAPSAKDITLLPNVTAGLNAILSGHLKTFGKEIAHVVYWDTTNESVKSIIKHYYKDSMITEIPFRAKYLDRLAESEDPEQVFMEALDDCMADNKEKLVGKKVLFCLEHTSPATGLTAPIAKLSKHIQQEYNYNHDDDAIVLVDGVQALLARNINLDSLFYEQGGVDIYLTNGHKWLSAPRGLGILAAKHKWYRSILRELEEVAYGVDTPELFSRYSWDESRDYAAALAIPAVLEYWNSRNTHGLTVLRYDLRRQVKKSVKTLAQHWHPADFHEDEASWPGRVTLANLDTPVISQMSYVALPEEQFGSGQTEADAKRVQKYLYGFNIEVPVKCINGKLFVRTSNHVYNTIEDTEHLANAIDAMNKPENVRP